MGFVAMKTGTHIDEKYLFSLSTQCIHHIQKIIEIHGMPWPTDFGFYREPKFLDMLSTS